MVWVISSDSDTRRLIGLNLSKRGLGHQEMPSQKDIAASDAAPHLIILDENAHGEMCWKEVQALRQNPRFLDVPLILILSAAPAPSLLLPLQPVRWVEKPLSMDVLLSQVQRSLA
jgi:DNA-binding response OmpR family regulator